MERPSHINELLPVQIQVVLDFVNKAQTVEDLTNIEKHRSDLKKVELSSYSIGEQAAQNILDTRRALPNKVFSRLDEVLSVKGIGEDKVLDIVEFMFLPVEEKFRQELFANVLAENWKVDYWRYGLDPEKFTSLERDEAQLKSFVAQMVSEIVSQKTSNEVIASLAKSLLERSFADRVEGGIAEVTFASWWYRFDEDNWFSFARISALISSFINCFGRQSGAYIDVVFFRGFQNTGTVAGGISPDDLVVTLNPTDSTISIWGITLLD